MKLKSIDNGFGERWKNAAIKNVLFASFLVGIWWDYKNFVELRTGRYKFEGTDQFYDRTGPITAQRFHTLLNTAEHKLVAVVAVRKRGVVVWFTYAAICR